MAGRLMPKSWIRVFPYVDRFGKERMIVLTDEQSHRNCLNCYGSAWPAVRQWLGLNQMLMDGLRARAQTA